MKTLSVEPEKPAVLLADSLNAAGSIQLCNAHTLWWVSFFRGRFFWLALPSKYLLSQKRLLLDSTFYSRMQLHFLTLEIVLQITLQSSFINHGL